MQNKKLMQEIEQLENELKSLLLHNVSLSDLDALIDIQKTICEKNIKYLLNIDKDAFN